MENLTNGRGDNDSSGCLSRRQGDFKFFLYGSGPTALNDTDVSCLGSVDRITSSSGEKGRVDIGPPPSIQVFLVRTYKSVEFDRR